MVPEPRNKLAEQYKNTVAIASSIFRGLQMDFHGDTIYFPLTMNNVMSNASSTEKSLRDLAIVQLTAGASMTQYSERIVEDILTAIFAERRGHFPETSSSCNIAKLELERDNSMPEPHVDKRLKYWREMLQTRRHMQKRVQIQTGKSPEQVLFNRRSTLENRNKETVVRLMDYADRLQPEKLATKPVAAILPLMDPCTCEPIAEPVNETWPQAEQLAVKDVEIVGLPNVIQEELLGSEAAVTDLQHSWMKSRVLDERIEKQFDDICEVLEFFPDLDKLQVTGTNVANLKTKPKTALLEEEQLFTISTSSDKMCSEEQIHDLLSEPRTIETDSQPEPPEIGLKVNGKDYVVCEHPFSECLDILTQFKCDPYQRRIKHVLKLQNIGKQTLSFNWKQGVYYYNCGSLLLAQDNEFLFDTTSFRLTHGECYDLVVLFQPRKVIMAVELWRLQVEPRIFCSNQDSMRLRFYGRCTPPKEYMARLKEMHCMSICKANYMVMQQLTDHLADLVPLTVPPPACCPYERTLDERELFNSLNPGYHCTRFDDLEVLKGMYKHLKMPREPQWDLRLETIKSLVMRIESVPLRKEMFGNLIMLSEPLLGRAPCLECSCPITEQKDRTRFIYVRGVICNGIEEWEDLVIIVEESFYKPELQRYYMHLMEEDEEEQEEDVEVEVPPRQIKLLADISVDELDEEKVAAAVMRKLHHSKYFRDALYIQTYSHLCNIAENIVSVIESTEVVPT